MITELGFGALILTLIAALYSIFAALRAIVIDKPAWLESARAALIVTAALCSISVFSMLYLLVRGHFQIVYVFNQTSSGMPFLLKVAALWGGQAGSLLFWVWLITIITAIAMLRKWQNEQMLLPWVIVILAGNIAFFLGLVIFAENPFLSFWQTSNGQQIIAMFKPAGARLLAPSEGRGLNPLLRHTGMILHPPLLYLGFVVYFVPYAVTMAALIRNKTDATWVRMIRPWSLTAWFFLSLGLVLGSRWAYDVLGWGGYWGWDPVEIAALMPWLAGTAYLHSIMIQEKRGLFKRWNIILILITYALIIFGTFLTRSGLLSSVHAFAESRMGTSYFVFIAFVFIVTLWLFLQRWDSLHAEGSITSLLSRESLFLFNNLLFMGVLVVCFWGVIFPLVSELFTGQKVSVGPPFYEQATAPLFAALIFLMGIAPLSAWGRSTIKTLGRGFWAPMILTLVFLIFLYIQSDIKIPFALLAFTLIVFSGLTTLYEYSRSILIRSRLHAESLLASFWYLTRTSRRRYGGYLIHISILLISVGVVGMESFQRETQASLKPQESLTLSNYTLTYQTVNAFNTRDGRLVSRAVLDVEKNGRLISSLHPRLDFYYDIQQTITVPGIISSLEGDLYAILVEWHPDIDGSAVFKVYYNPLVNWLWIGSFVLILGTIVAFLPEKKPYHNKT